MKSYTDPSEILPGEKFWIEMPGGREKVKCIWNDVTNRRLEYKFYILFVLPLNCIVAYSDSDFKSFAAMNK